MNAALPPNPHGAPTPADLDLEQRIEAAQTALALAPKPLRRAAFDDLRRLVHRRSSSQVARMEWDRGLR